MTPTDDIKLTTTHTPEPRDYDMGFIVAPDPAGQHPDIYIAEIAHDDDEGRIAPYEQHEANARRIVAAVNACKGISTEALERGIIADLRLVLSEIVTAAGDLDAVIDGATDQFDDERGRMNAAIRAAQAVLDGGMDISVHELLASRGQIAHIWSIEEVLTWRPDLTEKQAWQVLQDVETQLDSEYGISRRTIEIITDELFGPAPETTDEEK